MAIPTEELLQEDFDFSINEANLDQFRQVQNILPLLGAQRGAYGLSIGSGGTNLAGGYMPSYSVATDPTYSSGFQYAQQIAGGMPFEQVVAPGMSFSLEFPMGYTQAQLDMPVLTEAPVMPVPPATTGQVFEPSYPTMPYAPTGTPMPTIFGMPTPQLPQIDLSQIQLPEIDLSQIQLPEIDVSQFVTKEELPSFIPSIPSYEMPQIPEIDVSQFVGREELPSLVKSLPIELPQIDTSQFVSRQELPNLLPSIPQFDTSQFLTKQDIGELRSDILGSLPQPQIPDVSRFVTQQDINAAIAGIPQVSLSDIEARLAALELAPVPTVPSYNLPKSLGFFS